jgi:hypothetical protein
MDILKFQFSQIFLRAIHGRVVTIYKFDFSQSCSHKASLCIRFVTLEPFIHGATMLTKNHFVKNSIELDNLEVIVEIFFDHL